MKTDMTVIKIVKFCDRLDRSLHVVTQEWEDSQYVGSFCSCGCASHGAACKKLLCVHCGVGTRYKTGLEIDK